MNEQLKQPWTDDLNEFLAMLNPSAKSYPDVKKAVEVAWQSAFTRYATMLIFKDETPEMDPLVKVEKVLDWESDFRKWSLDKDKFDMESAKEAWEEAYNTYVLYGQTQKEINEGQQLCLRSGITNEPKGLF